MMGATTLIRPQLQSRANVVMAREPKRYGKVPTCFRPANGVLL
jgi:hypothetical protein